MRQNDTAAKRLLGMRINDAWTVIEVIEKKGTQTGGFFSQGYLARSDDGGHAFLKAMDFSEAAESDDFARTIEHLARQFNFERDILDFCKDKRMKNVVRSIGGGVVDVGGTGNPLDRVQYFLFEPANGDIRKMIDGYDQLTLAWCLSVLHESALGLRQLHGSLIAHQDIKPSNILSFSGDVNVKIGDLGCASMRGHACPRDGLSIPGQISYAPPEQLYSYLHPDWVSRRVGSDMYQLGGLCVFLFAGASINTLIYDRIDPEYHWQTWQGSYSEALPYIKLAYSGVMDDIDEIFNRIKIPKMISIVRELCEPDINYRGDPDRIRRGSQSFSVDPYVSRLGSLRRAAEYSEKRVVR